MVSFRGHRAPLIPVEKTPLQAAFEASLAFDVKAHGARLEDPAVDQIASEEAGFRDVRIPVSGLPSAAAPRLLDGALRGLKQWRAVRSSFDTALEPKIDDLNALEGVDDRIAEIRAEGIQARNQAESVWLADSRNSRVRAEHEEAEARLGQIKLAHANATPNMMAYSWIYLVLLFLINVAEWLINYDIFLMFTGIPAIALGATLLLGFALAFAAHAHGTIIRQASYRFDRARPPSERAGTWRLLALATLAFLIVLGTAGGSRYAAVLRIVSSQAQNNILGGSVRLDADPLRDVLLSLLANFVAWLVGVFIAFYFHDPDPDFMEAQRQYDKAWSALRARRKTVELEIETIEAKFQKRVEDLRNTAATRRDSVKDEVAMLSQIEKHQAAIYQSLLDDARANAERFRTTLCRLAQSRGSEIVLTDAQTGQPLTPAGYRGRALDIEAALKEALA